MRSALALALVAVLLAPAVAGDWPSFRNNDRNTAFQPPEEFRMFTDVWWSIGAPKGAPVDASPVVAGTTVIVADWNGVLRALDVESGNVKWQHNFTAVGAQPGTPGIRISSTPAISGGRVYAVDTAGTLKSLDLETGRLLASAQVGATYASPAVHEGKLFIGNEAGEMKAYDTQTLTLLWTYATSEVGGEYLAIAPGQFACLERNPAVQPVPKGAIRSTASVFDGKVFFGALNNRFYAIEEQGRGDKSTALVALFRTNDLIWSSPVVDKENNNVVVGSYDERLYAFDALIDRPATANRCGYSNWTAKWTFQVPSPVVGLSKIHSSPAYDGSKLYFGTNSGVLYAVNAGTGTKAWEFKAGDVIVSSPAVSNGTVVVGSDDKRIYFLSASDGTKQKDFLTAGQIKSSPALSGSRTFISSFDGTTYNFGPPKPPRPDLIVESMSYANDIIRITVKNTGTAASLPCILRVEADGGLLQDMNLDALNPGETRVVDQIPQLGPGLHLLHALVDQTNVVGENNENNNHGYYNVTVVATTDTTETEGEEEGSALPAGGMLAVLTGLGTALTVRRRKRDD